MKLGPADKRRYVRQLLLPEVGVSGQERLLDERFCVDETPAHSVAQTYLVRAGLRHDTGAPALPPCAVSDPVDAAFAGAWLAVERIKAALRVGVAAEVPLRDITRAAR